MVGYDASKEIEDAPAWFGITPDECAKRILRGVDKNRAIIPITGMAWTLWVLMRLSPSLVIRLMKRGARQQRQKIAEQAAAAK